MFNKYILLVPSAFLLKKYINSVNNKESYNDNKIDDEIDHLNCSINIIKSLHKHVHFKIIEEVHRILSQPEVLDLIKCIYDSECESITTNISVNLLKIKIPELTNWETKTTVQDRNTEFTEIVQQIESKIVGDVGMDITVISKIINIYLKEVYINIINRFNRGVTMQTCKSNIHQDQLKFCDQLINKLVSLLPQYDNNLKYLESTNEGYLKNKNYIKKKNKKSEDFKETVLEQALLTIHSKFNNLNLNKNQKLQIAKCKPINDADIPNIKNMELIEKINSIKQIKSENDGKSRLDQLTEAANIHEKKKQISDLTLKEVVYNTNYTMLKLLELISKMLSSTSKKTVIDDDVNENDKYDKGFYTKNNLNNIITFLKKDENLFYTGVFLIVFALIMYAMNN